MTKAVFSDPAVLNRATVARSLTMSLMIDVHVCVLIAEKCVAQNYADEEFMRNLTLQI